MEDIETSDWLSSIKIQFGNYISASSTETFEAVVEKIVDDLLDEAVLEVVFDEHKTAKTCLPQQCISEEDIKRYTIVESNDGDIFGPHFVIKPSICRCPRCQRPMCPSVFAPHLENCVGIGRKSARIASLKKTNNRDRNYEGGSDDDDDDFWILRPEKTKKRKIMDSKKGQDKSNLKRVKNQNKKKTNKDTSYDESNEEI